MTAQHTLSAKSVLITGFPSLLAQSLAHHGLAAHKTRRVYLFCEVGNKEMLDTFKSSLTRAQQRRLKIMGVRCRRISLPANRSESFAQH